MRASCVNPYCSYDLCHCDQPCTCGLVQVGQTTDEAWDGAMLELRYTVTSRYRPQQPSGDRSQGGPSNSGPAAGHDHRVNPDSPEEVADPADLLELSTGAEGRRASVLANYEQEAETPTPHGDHASVRSARYKGHTIEVHTTYRVLVDGQELDAHMSVNDDGNVHYHGLPNYSMASAMDLVRQVIDSFPQDYPPNEIGDGHEGQEGGH
jgi:hypothetical protein